MDRKYKSLNYEKLSPVILEALRELSRENLDLEKELSRLEKRIGGQNG